MSEHTKLNHENSDRSSLLQVLQKELGQNLISSTIQYDELTIHVTADAIVGVMTILRDHPECLFNLLLDVCGVDYPNEMQRFRIVYHLVSIELNHRIRVKISADENTLVPSITSVFNAANWFERETYDLYGITFTDHPDLRRLLTDYGFEGHPLRKDFPVTGYVEVRYDPSVSKVVYEPVSLQQDYRVFDFISPWEGMTREAQQKETTLYTLPGDDKTSITDGTVKEALSDGEQIR